jgi:predicted small secreted protein
MPILMRASDFNFARFQLFSGAVVLFILAAIVLSGCTWTGKGKEVAQAMEKTATFKSRAFTGSMDFKMSGADASKSMAITFTGASDNTDPANPKMTMTMDLQGSRMTIALPGDGNMYMVSSQGTVGAPVPVAERGKTAIDSAAIYAALGKAVGDFKQSQPMQNAADKPVPTIAAKVDRDKICNDVLPAFGDLMSKASAGSGAAAMPGLGGGAGGLGGLGGICKIMLVDDPQVWFGIDNGALTDVALKANLAFPGAGPMQFSLDYHEYKQGEPQPSIKQPTGAKMYPSVQALAPAAGVASP